VPKFPILNAAKSDWAFVRVTVFVTTAAALAGTFSFSMLVEQATKKKKDADKIDIVFI
jgi:hypothetical protein